MDANFQGNRNLAASKNNYRVARVAQQASPSQGLRGHFSASLKAGRKLVKVDFIKGDLERRGETFTAHKRQTAEERQVTALAIEVSFFARTSASTFGTAARSFPLARRNTAANTFAVFLRPGVGSQIVEFH